MDRQPGGINGDKKDEQLLTSYDVGVTGVTKHRQEVGYRPGVPMTAVVGELLHQSY